MTILSTVRTFLSGRQAHLDDHMVLAHFNNEHPVDPDAHIGTYVALTDVTKYGATGDGATNDSDAVADAIAAGGTIYFPAGTYMVSDLEPAAGQTFLSDVGAILKKNANGAILSIGEAGVTVSGLTFHGNSGSFTGDCILAAGADNLIVEDCEFSSVSALKTAVTVNSSEAPILRRNRSTNAPFIVWNSPNAIVEANRIVGSIDTISCISMASNAVGGDVSGARVTGNYCEPNVAAFGVEIGMFGSGDMEPSGLAVSDNVVVLNGDCYGGISLHACGSGVVSGNTVRTSSLGAATEMIAGIEVVASSAQIEVVGNMVDGGGLLAPLVTLTSASDNAVSNNVLANPLSSATQAALRVFAGSQHSKTASRNVLSGNRIILPASSATKAIWLHSNHADAVVADNVIDGNVLTGDSSTSRGIYLDVNAGSVARTVVANNVLRSISVGFFLNGDANSYFRGNQETNVTTRFTNGGSAPTAPIFEANSWQFASAAPASQLHYVGEKTWNTAPSAASFGWVCTAGGTPGTWAVMASGFKPLTGDTHFVPATAFILSSGTPAMGFAGRVPAWLFDASSNEQVRGSYVVPNGWLTYAVDVYWSNAGAGSGDVRFDGNYSQRAAGDALDAGETSGSFAVAAPLLSVLKVSTLFATVTVDAAKTLTYMRIERNAAHVGDTLANDASMVGLVLRRLT